MDIIENENDDDVEVEVEVEVDVDVEEMNDVDDIDDNNDNGEQNSIVRRYTRPNAPRLQPTSHSSIVKVNLKIS